MNKPLARLCGDDIGKRIVLTYRGTVISGHLMKLELERQRLTFDDYRCGSDTNLYDPIPGILRAHLTIDGWSANIETPEHVHWHYANEVVGQDVPHQRRLQGDVA